MKPTSRRSTAPIASLLTVLTLVVTACSAPPQRPENEVYSAASARFEEGAYDAAVEEYDELLKQYPFSDKAEVASLKIAHAYYLAGKYDEAIASFNDFERLYPVSPLLAFVEYMVGRCWLDQARPGDRDKSSSENAARQFERLARRYPESIYARLAEFRLDQALENLASHELYVGDWYRERGDDFAARRRYLQLIDSYPSTESAMLAEQRVALLSETPAEAGDGADATADEVRAALADVKQPTPKAVDDAPVDTD